MSVQDDPKSVVNSVLRACRVLELLAEEGPEVPLARVAEATDLSRPTAHRLLSTLVIAGWVRRTTAGRYGLTVKVFTVGSSASGRSSLRDLAHPVLVGLAQATGDTAYLMVPHGGTALCLDRTEGPHPVRVHHVNVGDSIPLLSGAAPMAMVAFRPEVLQEAGLEGALGDPRLRARLATARRQGYIVSPDDLLQGVTAVGAPVRGDQGAVVGAVSVTGTNDRFDPGHVDDAAKLVTAAAAQVSRLLGHEPLDDAGPA